MLKAHKAHSDERNLLAHVHPAQRRHVIDMVRPSDMPPTLACHELSHPVLCASSSTSCLGEYSGGGQEEFFPPQSKSNGRHTRLLLLGIPEVMFAEGRYLNCPQMNMGGTHSGQHIEGSGVPLSRGPTM